MQVLKQSHTQAEGTHLLFFTPLTCPDPGGISGKGFPGPVILAPVTPKSLAGRVALTGVLFGGLPPTDQGPRAIWLRRGGLGPPLQAPTTSKLGGWMGASMLGPRRVPEARVPERPGHPPAQQPSASPSQHPHHH